MCDMQISVKHLFPIPLEIFLLVPDPFWATVFRPTNSR